MVFWAAVERHSEEFQLEQGVVPALDAAGRCLVLALHALSSLEEGQAPEDLRRAQAQAESETWESALCTAAVLGVEGPVRASLAVSSGQMPLADLPLEYRLLHRGAAGAYQLQRLSLVRTKELPGRLWREAFPSVGFIRHAYPASHSVHRLVGAYFWRLIRLLRETPRQVRILRSERRQGSGVVFRGQRREPE